MTGDTSQTESGTEPTAGLGAKKPRQLEDWHEDDGPALWWRFPVDEPPYCGHPNCDDWPGYHTHWTPLVVPDAPAVAVAAEAERRGNLPATRGPQEQR